MYSEVRLAGKSELHSHPDDLNWTTPASCVVVKIVAARVS